MVRAGASHASTQWRGYAPTRRALVAGLLAAAAGAPIWARRADAEAKYPERPVRIIVPYGLGSVADLTMRLVGDKLALKLGQRFVVENLPGAGGIAALGQRFVVENLPGAGGIAAARAALQAPADGYTIELLTSTTAISVPLFKKLPFDPLKDFVPISSVSSYDCVFVSNAAAEYKTMGDFLKGAHDKPGTLNIGTINVGSTQHLSAELLKSMSGANFVIIPFRTPPETVQALLRNDVQLVVDLPSTLQRALSEHKLLAVAATGPVSARSLGGIPTVAEAGVPGYEVASWNALYAPAGTPKETIEVLNAALHEVLADPEIRRRGADLGIDTRAGTPAEADAKMRADIAKWAKVIADAKIPKQ